MGGPPTRVPHHDARLTGSVIGPLVLLVLGVAAGWVAAGPAGAVGGAMLAVIVSAMVVVGAAVWVRRIGAFLEPSDAREVAPRPPGFGRVCDATYDRLIRETKA